MARNAPPTPRLGRQAPDAGWWLPPSEGRAPSSLFTHLPSPGDRSPQLRAGGGWLSGWPPLPPREARASPSSAEAAGAAPSAGPPALPAASIVPPAKKENGAGQGAACEESVSPQHHITREHHRSRLLTFLEVKQGWWSGQASLDTMARGPGHSHSPNDHQAPGAGGWKCTFRLCQGPPPTSGVSQAPLLSRQALSRKGSGSFTSIPVTCWKLVTLGRCT